MLAAVCSQQVINCLGWLTISLKNTVGPKNSFHLQKLIFILS